MIRRNIITILILGILLPISFAQAGTILSAYKYAWSNNVGYINFENVVVSSSALSGYAWSENSGWIKFNPALGGVLNDGTGNLSGSAWGEGLGWIDFNNVNINPSTGKFSGTATGDGIGTLTFDCSYCDVRTDWAQTAVETTTTASTPIVYSGSGSRGYVASALTPFIESQNKPLIVLPNQSGKLQMNLSAGPALLEISSNNLVSKTIFVIDEDQLNKTNRGLVLSQTKLVNEAFYDIYAIDENNHFVRYFNNPITITLPLAKNQHGLKNLRLYWLNDINNKWVFIPDAVFFEDKVVFKVNHLTKFAIFSLNDDLIEELKKSDQSLTLPADALKTNDGRTSLSTSTDASSFIGENGEVITPEAEGKSKLVWLWLLVLVLVFGLYVVKKGKN